MSVRRCVGALTALALTAALAGTMTAAEAEPVFVPATADLVGVGGSETQEALTLLAEGDATTPGWNDTHAAGRIASFDAIGDGLTPQIKLNEAHLPIDRPTDSAAGKRLLYGDHNDTDVDFVRSATPNTDEETSASLKMVPFAVDGQGQPVYNVIRNSATTREEFKAVFGSKGFLCATAARPLIEAGGLQQLGRPENGGVCGVATTLPTTNLTLNEQIVTATTVSGTSPAAGVARLSATVTAAEGDDPVTGAVEFREGNVIKGSARIGDDGTATFDVGSLSGGDHHFNARLVPDEGSRLEPSISDPVTVLVKRSTFTYITLPASAPTYGQGGDIKVSVSSTVTATGSVSIKVGSAAAKTVPLSAGKASLAISKTLKVGSYPVVVNYPGSAIHASSSKTATLVVKKAKLTATETFPSTVAKGKRAKGTVTVKITNSSMVPTGKIVIKRSWKVLAAGWLKNGRVTITLPPLVKGMNQLTINHAGTTNIEPMKKTVFILQMS